MKMKNFALGHEQRALNDLFAMLHTMRPAGSAIEREFIAEWLEPLGVYQDDCGNLLLQISNSPVLWSSHTDTVHYAHGLQRIEQRGDLIKLHKRARGASCLGADCTTGVWLMREMALARVPGLYVWHYGEEVGGIGSSHIADNCPDMLEGIKHAIAFDRKGVDNIITHQGGRCCSNAFALSLAAQLPGSYRPDSTGIFTDTANYADIIPECSNISVGYERAHSRFETQSISHALALRAALLRIDVSRLTCERDPDAPDPDMPALKRWHGFGSYADEWLTEPLWANERKEGEDPGDFLDKPYTYPAYYEREEDAFEDLDSWQPKKWRA